MDLITPQTSNLDPLVETLNGAGSLGSLSEGSDSSRNPVKQAEDELKNMQQQIESYNVMYQQLISQQKMAIKKLAEMDEKIKETNKSLEQERSFVETKEKEIKEMRDKLELMKSDENFDPFASEDPFDRDDPFKSLNSKVPLPEDDPFNPKSSSAIISAFAAPSNDPFAPISSVPSSRGAF